MYNFNKIKFSKEKETYNQEDLNRGKLVSLAFLGELDTLKNERYRTNTSLRKGLSFWAAWLISIWLLIVAGILIFNYSIFCLSDSVLNTLITTTTINIIGIILICFRDLFNGKSEQIIGQK